MTIEMYSVKDTMVGFAQPFCAANDSVALRMFIGSVRSAQPNFCNTYPENKQLFKIGSLDDQTGELTSEVKFLAAAHSYVVNRLDEDKEVENGKGD